MRRVVVDAPAWRLFGPLFVFLQAFDFATTMIGVRLGATEVNPIVAPLVHNWPLLVLFKLLITIFVCRLFSGRPVAATLIVSAYLLVGINNLRVIAELL